MPRKIAIVCAIVLLVSLFPVQGTIAAPPDPPDVPDFARETRAGAVLESKDGSTRLSLNPLLVEAVEIEEGVYKLVYEVGIPLAEIGASTGQDQQNKIGFAISGLFPSVAYASSDSHSGCDSTVSACAQLTLYYTQIGDHGWYQYATNKWTLHDQAVSWNNAKVIAACFSEWYQGSGQCNSQVTNSVGTPSSGSTYSVTPWFSGSSYDLKINSAFGIAASQWIDLHRGAAHWQFTFCVAVGGDSWYTGCY